MDWRQKLEFARKASTMTDKELAVLLPTLPLERRIEAVIAKYVSGASSVAYNGENSGDVASAIIARQLLVKLRPWLPTESK
jgi:hypothetical protein